jgi:hypothetical protein
MAKLSVYVPDELLERAKHADPAMRPSQVLQGALEQRLPRAERPYAVISDALREQRLAAQEIVNRRATEAYQEGYEVGLSFATALPWRAFENFAQLDWNLNSWVYAFDKDDYEHVTATPEELAAGEEVLDFWGALDAAMTTARIPVREEDHCPVGLSAEGFVDAIRDVWLGSPTGRDVATHSGPTVDQDVGLGREP